ncbi:uncharacterized protein F4812DRAFT_277607 [Daldinia caldariorum]|uniref:uncharacterized protein n=1 Tax=Daldinia caldariorum TaxID=326644 RepID=UPI0020088F6C|nr:uncharacterized protein F4812DRAFT_277607 [Daldinia caldariorum]KAI1470759.1 hypothetical protein F4812DRAFT_277607 [Daldinia caldariorum]
MVNTRRGRSSSLFSSSSQRSRSSDWLFVSSPTSQSQSQSQPPPIQQPAPRMSSTKSAAGNAEQLSSQKKASSLAGFFSKMLPSNRPEQGGTHRTDWTVDNDNTVGPSRNELTTWNLAKEKSPARDASTDGPGEPSHRRVWNWSPQKGDSRFVENLPRERSRSRDEQPEDLDHEPQPPRKSEALRRTEVHELLQSKEESRKSRRSLKESGDWLGVQGADPYSGMFSVLTPTDTLSSETTSTSTRSKLSGLALKRKAAKLEYEQLRLLEEQAKDKARLDREQAKLDKIERVKEELRRQHQFARWSQHKRNWSSAAEPNLSPIAQSLDSVALGSSEASSLLFSELPTDSCPSDSEGISAVIPNFSRPTRSPVSKAALPGQVERLSYDDTQPRGRRNLDQSTETIIHNSPGVNFGPTYLTRPVTQPSETSPKTEQPNVVRTKSERRFLWRRRRETDPGKLGKSHQGGIGMPMVAQYLTPNPIEDIHKDHFADLAIPDYHLHLLSPEPVEPVDTADSQSTFSEDSSVIRPNASSLGMNKMALSSTTNLVYLQGNGRSSQSTKSAPPVTSSSSKLKDMMWRPSIRRKLIVPSLLTTVHTKDTEKHRMSPPTFDELQDRTVNNLPTESPLSQNPPIHPGQQGRISLEEASKMLNHTENHHKRARRESVSTPTTTIIGYVPAQQSQPESPQPERSIEPSQIDGAADILGMPASPTPLRLNNPCIILDPIPERRRTPSLPRVPQKNLPNLEPAREIPGIGTSSTHRATLEKKPPTRISTPTSLKLCLPVPKNGGTDQVDIAKGGDTIEKVETNETEKTEHLDTKKISPQERRGRIYRESHSVSVTRAPTRTPTTITSREARHRRSWDGQRESIVEEAVRVAMLRSKAKEIVRGRSADHKVGLGLNRSRTLSPVRKQAGNGKAPEPKHPLPTPRRPRKERHGEGVAGIARPSRPKQIEIHVSKNIDKSQLKQLQQQQPQIQIQPSKGDTTEEFAGRRDPPVTVMQFCKTVYIVILGLTCTWWTAARPAFDPQSDLWRRRCKNESTWSDVGVFTSAGLFCLAGALCGWYASRLCWWLLVLQ